MIDGDLLYLGSYTGSTASQSADMYDGFLQRKAHLSAEEIRTGAFMLAVNRNSGDLVWAKRLSGSVSSSTINSAAVHEGVVYVGLTNLSYSANWIDTLGTPGGGAPEFAVPIPSFDGRFEHEEARGGLLALDADTGAIIWKVYHAPPRPADLSPDTTWYSGASAGYAGAIAIEPRMGGATLFVGTSNNSTVPLADMLCEKRRRESLTAAEEAQLVSLLAKRSEQFGGDVSCEADVPGETQLNDAFHKSVVTEHDGAGEPYPAYSFGNMADSVYALRVNPQGRNPRLRWTLHSNVYDRFNELCSLMRPEALRDLADTLVDASVFPLTPADIFHNVDDLGNVQECAGQDSLNGTDAIGFLGEPMGVANTDFAVGPVLTKDEQDDPIIVALNKDGFLYFINPVSGELVSKVRQGPFAFAASFGLAVGEDTVYSNVTFPNNRFTTLPFPFGNDVSPRQTLNLCHEFGVRFSTTNAIPGCTVPVEAVLSGSVVDQTLGAMVNAVATNAKRSRWMSPDPSGALSIADIEREPFFFDGTLIDFDFDASENQDLSFAAPINGSNDRLYLRSNYGGHLTATEDVVFVGSASSDVRLGMHALDAGTGEIIWVFPRSLFTLDDEYLPALVASAPAIVGDRLYWGTGQHGLFAPPVGAESGPGAFPITGEGGIFFSFELCPEGTKASADFATCDASDGE